MALEATVRTFLENHAVYPATFSGSREKDLSSFRLTIGDRERRGRIYLGSKEWISFSFFIEGVNHSRQIIFHNVVMRQFWYGHMRVFGETIHYEARQVLPEHSVAETLNPWLTIFNYELALVENMLFASVINCPTEAVADDLYGMTPLGLPH